MQHPAAAFAATHSAVGPVALDLSNSATLAADLDAAAAARRGTDGWLCSWWLALPEALELRGAGPAGEATVGRWRPPFQWPGAELSMTVMACFQNPMLLTVCAQDHILRTDSCL